MTNLYEKAQAAAAHIRTLSPVQPRVGIILGSGLGSLRRRKWKMRDHPSPTPSIPNFPQSTVAGHSGQTRPRHHRRRVPVAVMQGRVHAYEGYPMSEVTFPTRVLAPSRVPDSLIVTNAAGGINSSLLPGRRSSAIADHINLTGTNAALGPNDPRFARRPGAAQRFFDMS